MATTRHFSVSNCSFNRSNIFAFQSSLQILNSTFSNSIMGGVVMYNSHLSMTGNISFMNNSILGNGRALSLIYTDVTLNAPANITFMDNTAAFNGGAVFIDYCIGNYGKCVIAWNDPNGTLDNTGIHLHFDGNHANQSGNMLYGGDIDKCGLYTCEYTNCSSLLTILNAATTHTKWQLVSNDILRSSPDLWLH